jgi:Trypsin
MSAYAGQTARAVGYGITGKSAEDFLLKRQVSLVLNSVDVDNLFIGDGVGRGICHGDSGGPTFFTFPDGVERLVGIHSYDANLECTSGADVRVDAYADFIDSWLEEREVPECGLDGLCREECTPVDPDCIGIGDRCESALQCRSGECVPDAQHPETYCSRPCDSHSECPTGMECASDRGVCTFIQLPLAAPGAPCTPGATFCAGGTVCTRTSPSAASCSTPCERNSDCGVSATCALEIAGIRYCQPVPEVQAPKAAGCTTSGGGPLMLLPLMAWMLGSRLRARVCGPTRARRRP